MPRQYTSPLRAGQARQTRLVIIEAAIKLFLENGYVETSIRKIANEAGVSERTVYVAFKDKVSILTAIGDYGYYGGTEQGEGEAEFKESLAAISDPTERLRMVVHQSAIGLEQGLAALARMVNFAAHSDSRLKEWIAEMVDVRHRDMRAEAEVIIGRELPEEETYDQMVDEIEAITSEEVYWILTQERGWPRDNYEAYVVEMCLVAMKRHGVDLT